MVLIGYSSVLSFSKAIELVVKFPSQSLISDDDFLHVRNYFLAQLLSSNSVNSDVLCSLTYGQYLSAQAQEDDSYIITVSMLFS